MTNEQSSKTLTPVQKRFCKEYVLDFCGTEAVMRANGSTNRKASSVAASKYLKMPKIKEYIDAYVQDQLGPLEKDLLGNVTFWIGLRDDDKAAMASRLKASEHLAKYRSMFIEKKEISVEGQVVIVDDIK